MHAMDDAHRSRRRSVLRPLTRTRAIVFGALAALLVAQGVSAEQVATAVNGAFVPRAQRDTTVLNPGDTVLTFQAIVGG